MNTEKIKILLEKYFEAQTSLAEEQLLREYFSNEKVADELKIYQPVFQHFTKLQHNSNGLSGFSLRVTKSQRKPLEILKPVFSRHFYYWAAAAVLALLIALPLMLVQPKKEQSLAYIDGRKYTNINVIAAQSLNGLENLADDKNLISTQIALLDDVIN